MHDLGHGGALQVTYALPDLAQPFPLEIFHHHCGQVRFASGQLPLGQRGQFIQIGHVHFVFENHRLISPEIPDRKIS
jgi:hypothetical protein